MNVAELSAFYEAELGPASSPSALEGGIMIAANSSVAPPFSLRCEKSTTNTKEKILVTTFLIGVDAY